MEEKFTLGQLKIIADFFNMMAVAWLSADVISPFFIQQKPSLKSLIFSVISLTAAYFSLDSALRFAKEI